MIEKICLQKAIEEAELELAYEWFYDRYDEEDQERLLNRFENDPVRFVKEERCGI